MLFSVWICCNRLRNVYPSVFVAFVRSSTVYFSISTFQFFSSLSIVRKCFFHSSRLKSPYYYRALLLHQDSHSVSFRKCHEFSFSIFLMLTKAQSPYAFPCITRNFLALSFLTLPMPKSRGFLAQQSLRRPRRIGVVCNFLKCQFPCAPRYLFPWHFRVGSTNNLPKFL